jgi:PAS domain S-box-containing protein
MPWRKPVKFLLVDDVEENLVALEALLARDGLELLKAASAAEALELLLHHEVALALLDVQMPETNGFELAELMRGTARTRQIPIIFLTAVATEERLRFRGYEAGAVDYLLKPLDPHMLRNKANVFFELARQKAELAWQRDQLRMTASDLQSALSRLQAHGDNSPLAIVEFDPEFRLVSWSKGAERLFGWKARETVGKHVLEFRFLHEDDHPDFERLAADMLAGRIIRNDHACRAYRKDGSVVECEWYNSALQDDSGSLVSINAQILDVTDRRRAEEARQLLLSELNHRVKNTLATVQAIATQTLRRSGTAKDFTTKFSGRIQSLARAHSLLSSATWQEVGLGELIENQLNLGVVDDKRFVLSGPEVRLPAQLALHLALILHELGTNARKYGALSSAQGTVSLGWTVEGRRLQLTWTETGGPLVKAPAKRGFGSTLIEQIVSGSEGEARASYRAEGVVWTIATMLSASSDPGPAERPPAIRAPANKPTHSSSLGEEAPEALAGRRLLVIEDEPLVALDLASILEDAGAEIVGPAGNAEQALALIASTALDGALLDGNLHGKPVDDIAAALTRQNIPFLFVTGYGRETLPLAFRQAAILGKPFTDQQLLEAAEKLMPRSADMLRLRN